MFVCAFPFKRRIYIFFSCVWYNIQGWVSTGVTSAWSIWSWSSTSYFGWVFVCVPFVSSFGMEKFAPKLFLGTSSVDGGGWQMGATCSGGMFLWPRGGRGEMWSSNGIVMPLSALHLSLLHPALFMLFQCSRKLFHFALVYSCPSLFPFVKGWCVFFMSASIYQRLW